MKYHFYRVNIAYSNIEEAYRCKKILDRIVRNKDNVYFIHDPETMYFKVGVLVGFKTKFLIRFKAYMLASLIKFAVLVDKKFSN